MKIYLWETNNETGPFSKSEVLLKQKEREINGAVLARSADDVDWRPLNELLQSLPMALFSLEQIERVQAALPPPVVIPSFQCSGPIREIGK